MKTGFPNGCTPSSRSAAGAANPASMRPRSFVRPARPESASAAVSVFTPRHCSLA
jgi:hypothetical protein